MQAYGLQNQIRDRIGMLETRARLLLKLERFDEAQQRYRCDKHLLEELLLTAVCQSREQFDISNWPLFLVRSRICS